DGRGGGKPRRFQGSGSPRRQGQRRHQGGIAPQARRRDGHRGGSVRRSTVLPAGHCPSDVSPHDEPLTLEDATTTWLFRNDSIEHGGRTLYRLAGTHDTERDAEDRARRIRRRRGVVAIVRPLVEPRPNGRGTFAIYVEDAGA